MSTGEAVGPGVEGDGIVVAPLDQSEAEPAPEEPPLSLSAADLGVVFQGVLLALALLSVCHFAKPIILPVVLAFVLGLLLSPAMRFFDRVGMPRVVGSLILIFALAALVVGLIGALTAPAVAWFEKLLDAIPRLQKHLAFLSEPVERFGGYLRAAQGLIRIEPAVVSIPTEATTLSEQLFHGTWNFAAGLFTTVLLLFFLLISGDTFLRRLVEVLPRFREKRQAVEISQQIESDISVYLVTITVLNGLVGVATAVVMWACGVGDPVLWGAVAFALNYVPILGPLVGVGIFLLVGLLTLDPLLTALLPAGLYLIIHVIEGEGITPMLLARRFTLNPVLVIRSLVFWYWMWGVPGAVLAVPMLAMTKIICDRVRPLAGFGHFLAG